MSVCVQSLKDCFNVKADRLREYTCFSCPLFVAWWRRYDMNDVHVWIGTRLSEALHRQLVAHW